MLRPPGSGLGLPEMGLGTAAPWACKPRGTPGPLEGAGTFSSHFTPKDVTKMDEMNGDFFLPNDYYFDVYLSIIGRLPWSGTSTQIFTKAVDRKWLCPVQCLHPGSFHQNGEAS